MVLLGKPQSGLSFGMQ